RHVRMMRGEKSRPDRLDLGILYPSGAIPYAHSTRLAPKPGTIGLLSLPGEDLQAMARRGEASGLADLVAQGDEFGNFDRDDLAGVDTDDQVVGRAAVDQLIVGL